MYQIEIKQTATKSIILLVPDWANYDPEYVDGENLLVIQTQETLSQGITLKLCFSLLFKYMEMHHK